MTSHIPEDWQCSRRLAESNKYMLDNQIECDVTFTLTGQDGDLVYTHAHKFILISRSPVFFAMLSGPLAEKDRDIRVTDISPDIFRLVLGYLYYEHVDLDVDNVFLVLYTAKKYFVTALAKECLTYLSANLSPSNVCAYLDNAFLFEEDVDLHGACMDLVQQQSNKVFHSDSFCDMSRDALCRVLRVERLTIREIDVFRACMNWANAKCRDDELELNGANRRNVLGEAVRFMHFPTMSINEFTKFVVPTEVLSTDEENGIFRYLLNPEQSDPLSVAPFPTLSRDCVECRCDVTYAGFVKHTTSYSALFQGMPQRSKWSMSLYSDHTIKLQQIAFLGKFKGSIYLSQNGLRKFEVSCDSHVSEITLEDDIVSLDSGLFTIATEVPFSYLGDYFSKSVGDPCPQTVCDQDKVGIVVRDSTPFCFLSSIVFVPSDEIHFVDDYFVDD